GAYGVLNLTNMAYAYGDGQGAGRRMGLNRAVSTMGPVVALAAGGYLVTVTGPQQVFVIYGLIGLLAVPLALMLPPLRQPVEEKTAQHRWRPSALNVLFFVIALSADGLFTATLSLLLADLFPVSAALVGAGLLLAAQRLISVLLAWGSGPIIDRFDAQRVLVPGSLGVALGLALIAAGAVYAGAVVLIVTRAGLAIAGPIVTARQAPADRLGAMAAYTTWSDTGLALGPLLASAALASTGLPLAYGLSAAAVLAALVWYGRTKKAQASEV
ncbi:MAG: MFS transporter, partial [Variibacter sp.]|nr:MFS transporter [Variibacter sp.]